VKIEFNGESLETPTGATIADLLKQKNIDPQRVAVEVNLQLTPRREHDAHVLCEGDAVEVVTFVGGG